MSAETVNALEVRGLAKSFGGVKAVGGVDFDVKRGELLALIGPNGAGKTTCFNMLNGQLRPNAGAVKFEGRELVGMKPIAALAAGDWDDAAVRALLYVAMVKQLPEPFAFDDMDMDFGALASQFAEPDLELEASMPMTAGP